MMTAEKMFSEWISDDAASMFCMGLLFDHRGTYNRPYGHSPARIYARTVNCPYELWPATADEDAT